VTCRGLLLAILVYVTLDLSLAGMPGAFVFDAADSVESVHRPRARGAATLVAVPATAVAISPPMPLPSPPMTPALAATPRVPHTPGVVTRLPRAGLAPSRSDDPY
jgi:hypothetical protein